ncbi:glycoside hydrolase superfamily [Cubamyces lactineus]|nr:glycoside hydrolase superfamily [Cubamyces lactineus]
MGRTRSPSWSSILKPDMSPFWLASALSALSLGALQVAAYDNSRSDNLAVYWGQNSYGATHTSDSAHWQKSIGYYCQDDSIDAIPIAFLNVFQGTGGYPSINLANICNTDDSGVFPGTSMPNCTFLASDIEYCQSQGKIVTISLGGATGAASFSSAAQATAFGDTIWNMFLGGTGSIRPFGGAVLDGIDLDIEGGNTVYFDSFINRIRQLASGAAKQYYVTAAPQCPYPDAYLGTVLNAVGFDAVYVQFYNNWCGLQNYNNIWAWDFSSWDTWAKTVAVNPNVKIYIGAPASSTAAGAGYVDSTTLANIALEQRGNYSSFGGVMLWDASQAYANNRYDTQIKNAIRIGSGGATTSNPVTVPTTGATSSTRSSTSTRASTTSATTTSRSSTTTTSARTSNTTTRASSTTKTSTTTKATSTTKASTTTTKASTTTRATTTTTPTTSTRTSTSTAPASTGGACSGVSAWGSSTTYVGGNQVTYNGHLWTAKWWSYNDVPGGPAGVWTDNGAC